MDTYSKIDSPALLQHLPIVLFVFRDRAGDRRCDKLKSLPATVLRSGKPFVRCKGVMILVWGQSVASLERWSSL
jgi:hypothetical protein